MLCLGVLELVVVELEKLCSGFLDWSALIVAFGCGIGFRLLLLMVRIYCTDIFQAWNVLQPIQA